MGFLECDMRLRITHTHNEQLLRDLQRDLWHGCLVRLSNNVLPIRWHLELRRMGCVERDVRECDSFAIDKQLFRNLQWDLRHTCHV
jgi:hypothetical protein